MNKKITAAALIGILAVGGGAIAAGKYADKRLQAFYQNQNADGTPVVPNMHTQLQTFDMGLLSGTARWQADYIPNLCSPEAKITLRAEDNIRRGLSGYHITSKVYLVQPDGGEDIFLFNADTRTAWGGDINSQLTVPAGSHHLDSLNLSWAEANAHMQMKRQGAERILEHWTLDIPEITLTNQPQGLRFRIEGLKAEADIPMHPAALRSGTDSWSIAAITVHDNDTVYTLEKLSAETKQQVQNDTVAFTGRLGIDRIKLGGRVLDKIAFQAAVPNLNKDALSALYSLNVRQHSSCVPAQEVQAELEKIALQAVHSGLSIESKENRIEINGSHLSAEAEATVPAGQYASLQALQQALPNIVQYRTRVEIDKTFVHEVVGIRAALMGRPVTPEEGDIWIQELLRFSGGQEEGDKIVISKQK